MIVESLKLSLYGATCTHFDRSVAQNGFAIVQNRGCTLTLTTCAVLQNIAIYAKLDQPGDGIVFRSNWKNLNDVPLITAVLKLFYCVD